MISLTTRYHAAAGLNKTIGDAMTDAARGAGNESNLTVELHGGAPQLLR